MNEVQSWVLIGMFTTIMLGGMSLMTMLINRSIGMLDAKIDAKIDGLRNEMIARVDGLRGEMDVRFDALSAKVDALDRDVAALTRKVWGEPPD